MVLVPALVSRVHQRSKRAVTRGFWGWLVRGRGLCSHSAPLLSAPRKSLALPAFCSILGSYSPGGVFYFLRCGSVNPVWSSIIHLAKHLRHLQLLSCSSVPVLFASASLLLALKGPGVVLHAPFAGVRSLSPSRQNRYLWARTGSVGCLGRAWQVKDAPRGCWGCRGSGGRVWRSGLPAPARELPLLQGALLG